MRHLSLALLLGLAACGGGADEKAANEAAATVDAVTAEGVADTRAATNDAAAAPAADAALARLDDTIDDGAPANAVGNRVSNTTALTVY